MDYDTCKIYIEGSYSFFRFSLLHFRNKHVETTIQFIIVSKYYKIFTSAKANVLNRVQIKKR